MKKKLKALDGGKLSAINYFAGILFIALSISFTPVVITLAFVAVLLVAMPASATDWYYANTAQGSNNGTSCANAYAWNDGTNGVNASAKNAAGNNLHVCGTIIDTTLGDQFWTPPNSGSSGNPITLVFENGAGIQDGYWGDNPFSFNSAAITCINKNFITVDTGTNGVIQNTANGTGLANTHASTLVGGWGCSNFTLKGSGTIGPVYVHTIGDNNGIGNNMAVTVGSSGSSGASNITITGTSKAAPLTVFSAHWPINIGDDTSLAVSNVTLQYLNVDSGCHLLVTEDNNINSSMSNVSILDSNFGPHNQNWADNNAACHQDGVFLTAVNTGSQLSNVTFARNTITSDMCSNQSFSANNCTGLLVFGENINGANVFNNLIHYTSAIGGYEGLIILRNDSNLGQQNIAFYNNTIDMGSSAVGSGCKCDIVDYDMSGGTTSATGFKFKNNIVLNANGNNVFDMEAETINSVWGSNIDYNDYFNVTAAMAHEATGNVTYHWASPVTWPTSHATNSFPGEDSHGSIGNPNVNATTYALQAGSAAIGLGTNLTSLGITPLNSDALLVARPASGAWDGGWKQFNSTPPPRWNPGITIQ